MGDPNKLFGRYQEVTLLFLGFLLTTVVGGFLGAWFQARSWAHEHSIQVCESEKAVAIKGFDTLSDLMDTRLLRMRQLAWKLESAGTLADVEVERKNNSYARDEWSKQLNKNLAFAQRYFGDHARNMLEGDISDGFIRIYGEFNDLMKASKPDRSVAQKIENDIDSFNPTIYGFDLDVVQTIADGKLGKCSVP